MKKEEENTRKRIAKEKQAKRNLVLCNSLCVYAIT